MRLAGFRLAMMVSAGSALITSTESPQAERAAFDNIAEETTLCERPRLDRFE